MPAAPDQALEHDRPAPDSVNVIGYIVSSFECPERALCIISDGIEVAEHPDQEAGIFIPSRVPPYEKGVLYVLSVAFTDYTMDDDSVRRYFRLLGTERAGGKRRTPRRG